MALFLAILAATICAVSLYNDYLTYLDAHRFWSHNPTDVAPVRRREYDELVRELEIELIQMLKKGADEAP